MGFGGPECTCPLLGSEQLLHCNGKERLDGKQEVRAKQGHAFSVKGVRSSDEDELVCMRRVGKTHTTSRVEVCPWAGNIKWSAEQNLLGVGNHTSR